MKTFNVLSLFTGAGGLDLGFEMTGRFQTLAAIECESQFAATLKKNIKMGYLTKATVIEENILNLFPMEVAKDSFPNACVDGIIGGPPCEAFSVFGSRNGFDDPRAMFIGEFFRWVKMIKPKFALMENVPPLARMMNGSIISGIAADLEEAGYSVDFAVLNASDYGAATSRKRLILLASRGKPINLPKPTHTGEAGRKKLTVRDALSNLPPPFDDQYIFPTWHRRVVHTEDVRRRFQMLKPGQKDEIRRRRRVDLNRPCPAIVAGNLSGTRSHIHPTEPREMTNRELARIHGFPDDFEFCGTRSAVCKQIANSVPVQFAYELACEVSRHLA